MPTRLETWSALRVAYADLPAATIAAIVPQLDPETAARVQAIITEFDADADPCRDQRREVSRAREPAVMLPHSGSVS
jgi:hypothetical protein